MGPVTELVSHDAQDLKSSLGVCIIELTLVKCLLFNFLLLSLLFFVIFLLNFFILRALISIVFCLRGLVWIFFFLFIKLTQMLV